MEFEDLKSLLSASEILRRNGFVSLDAQGRITIKPIQTTNVIRYDEPEQEEQFVVDPELTIFFDKFFDLLWRAWLPERRGNPSSAKSEYWSQVKKAKYDKRFPDYLERAGYAYEKSTEPQYWKTLAVWLQEWRNWATAYQQGVKDGKYKPIEPGVIWNAISSSEGDANVWV